MDKKSSSKKPKWKFWATKKNLNDVNANKPHAVSQKRARIKKSFETAILEGNIQKFNELLVKYANCMVADDVFCLINKCMNADEPDLKHDTLASSDDNVITPPPLTLHPPTSPPPTKHLTTSNSLTNEHSFLQVVLKHVSLLDFYGTRDLAPIHIAVKLNKLKAVITILNTNPKLINLPTKSDQKVPLHFAVESDSLTLVQLLLNRGANVKAKDIYGNNVLHVAASHGAEKVLNYLLQSKNDKTISETKQLDLDVNLPNNNGWTPLHLAAENKNEKNCELLLQNGAFVDVKSKSGKTALHWASLANSPECVAVLLKHSADVSVVDNLGKAAINYADNKSIKRLISADELSLNEKKSKSDFVPLKKIKVRIDPRSDNYWRVFSTNEQESNSVIPRIQLDLVNQSKRKSKSMHGRVNMNKNLEDERITQSLTTDLSFLRSLNKLKYNASDGCLIGDQHNVNGKINNRNVNTNINDNNNNIIINIENKNDVMNRSENTLTAFLMDKLKNAKNLTGSISSFKSFCSKNNSPEDKISELPKSISSENTSAKNIVNTEMSRSTTSPSESGIFEILSLRDDDDGDLNIFLDSSNHDIRAPDFATNCKFQCLSITYSQIHKVIVNSLKHNCETQEMKGVINLIMKNFKNSSALLEKFTISILLLVRNPDEVWLKICSQKNFKSLASYETLLFLVGKMVALFQDYNEFCRCQGCVDRLMLLCTLFIMQHTSENNTPIKLTVSMLKTVMPTWVSIKEDLYKLLITEILKFYETKKSKRNDTNTNDLVRDIYTRMRRRKRKIFDREYSDDDNLNIEIDNKQMKNDFCEFVIETVESDHEWIFDI